MLMRGFPKQKNRLRLSREAKKSTLAEWLCNSGSIQNVPWIKDQCIETNYNEPCDNATQPALQRFLLKQWGHFSFWRHEWEADQQPAETSSCFSTHPHKRIGHNGVSSSLAPSAHQINCRKLSTKSESAILAAFYSHPNNKFWRNTGAISMGAQLSF